MKNNYANLWLDVVNEVKNKNEIKVGDRKVLVRKRYNLGYAN